ncbi:SH3 domain-containing protein [Neptunicella sp. SCSIO 80796]|uniref:SH3 domain-containing protein n=1 Tax=Neptunicella plasticusilytica TaxID=3117012 RepID=UPI003A4D32AD
MKTGSGLLLLCMLLLISKLAVAEDEYVSVQVAEPFIELHSGPAQGYPVFHVVEKGRWIWVLKRHTDWFKVRTDKGIEGWVDQAALHLTLDQQGEPVSLFDGSFDSYQQRRFELGVMGGVLESVPALSVVGGWQLTDNISTQLSYSQALGDFSENQLLLLSVRVYPFPEWRISPFFSLGTGRLKTTPRANLVQSGAETRNSDLASAAIGSRFYLARNFVLNLQYQHLLALTDRDSNEELEQWQLGFIVFF